MRPLRPGVDALTVRKVAQRVKRRLEVTQPDAFGEGDDIPSSTPPMAPEAFPAWPGAACPRVRKSVALLVEDADIPFVQPVTHLIVHSISPEIPGIEPGAVPEVDARPRRPRDGRPAAIS